MCANVCVCACVCEYREAQHATASTQQENVQLKTTVQQVLADFHSIKAENEARTKWIAKRQLKDTVRWKYGTHTHSTNALRAWMLTPSDYTHPGHATVLLLATTQRRMHRHG